MWKDVAREVFDAASQRINAETNPLIVMIVGEVDAGKSTLCTYLANAVLSKTMSPCIVDADIGQGDMAPPSAIGAALLDKPLVDLGEVNATLFEFIGTISPAGAEQLVANAIQSICQRSRELGHFLIVNTDGYVEDGGARYKRLIADQIQPDMIICLGENKPLERALADGAWRLIRAKTSEVALKSRLERKRRRYGQFMRFAGVGHLQKPLAEVRFNSSGNAYFDHTSIPMTGSATSLENLFVGLGVEGYVMGFGIIKRINNEFIEIQTDVQDPDTVYLSNIKITNRKAEQIIL